MTPTSNAYQAGDWLGFLKKSDKTLLKHCRIDEFKSTGRGGQKRNKVANAIRLTLSHLTVTDSSTRSRTTNLQRALRKLRIEIALDINDIDRRCQFQTFPEEVLPYLGGDLIRISPNNPVFPFFVAGFIDLYTTQTGNWKKSAEVCQVSVSQLRKFAKKHPFLVSTMNQIDVQIKAVAAEKNRNAGY